ncbi:MULTISPECIES: TadE/TadG family type IV pilus assembly protein [Streptomyces]|uniref:TadE/TadG family type IV pilus assembly protein n=1 Tax=Streptomyces noboritoensis TaxID=67337 RepID=A0ABV6TCM1_9ACTN|nr:TadE/TadG family type IV pilus assembly protein [Streptomyces melanogenes]GGP78185.1 membrane protein [Streptomyces melanogenes]
MKQARCAAQWARTRHGDEGSAAIEATIILPALIMFVCLALAGGRIVTSGAKIDAAAQDAAREASIHRTAAAALSAARSAADESLQDQGIACASTSVSIDTGGLRVPVGQVGTVTVTVTCTVPLADLLLPGLPGAKTLTATATSVVDQYRQRALGLPHPQVTAAAEPTAVSTRGA